MRFKRFLACALLLVVTCSLISGCAKQQVSEGVVKDALITFANDEAFADNSFIDKASYSVDSFTLGTISSNSDGSQTASFEAVLSNGKIESNVTASITFTENSGKWSVKDGDSGLSIESVSNRALTGVDYGDMVHKGDSTFDEGKQQSSISQASDESNWLVSAKGQTTETFDFKERAWKLSSSDNNYEVNTLISGDVKFDCINSGMFTAQPRGKRYDSDPNGYFYPYLFISDFQVTDQDNMTGTMSVTFLWEPKNHYASKNESCVYNGTFKLDLSDSSTIGTFEISDPDWNEDLWALGMGMPETFSGEFDASDKTLEVYLEHPTGTVCEGPYKYQA